MSVVLEKTTGNGPIWSCFRGGLAKGKNSRTRFERPNKEVTMKLIVTIDVEEEGLFCGRCDQDNLPEEDVDYLRHPDLIFRDMDTNPTLLLTYPLACHILIR